MFAPLEKAGSAGWRLVFDGSGCFLTATIAGDNRLPFGFIGGDPNGIRTRVTGVRGRCPEPLDDGTTAKCGCGI
jgi:hypothetical protein